MRPSSSSRLLENPYVEFAELVQFEPVHYTVRITVFVTGEIMGYDLAR